MRQSGFERTFRAGGGAGNQAHAQVRMLAQPQHRGHRVFLRAAYNQTGDDVSDAHFRFWNALRFSKSPTDSSSSSSSSFSFSKAGRKSRTSASNSISKHALRARQFWLSW